MKLIGFLTAMILALATAQFAAQADNVEVDAELILAVDVSRSMSPGELEIQRRGYAEALVSREVVSAITSGLLGRVAFLYVEWAGDQSHRVIVDWVLISNQNEAEDFAARLTARFDSSLRRTSISGVLDYSTEQFDKNNFTSSRKIIDVSGDGPNNQGRPVLLARKDTLARGIVINGLPLMTKEGMGSQFHLDNLDEYYRNCVIGGPGSFIVPVHDWDQFPAAVRRKLVLELVQSNTPTIVKVAQTLSVQTAYDCLIGEKIWDQFRQNWNEP
jgi:hypothetical protein